MPTNRIDSVNISEIPPINEVLELTLDPRVNLLIGPNGCGKSTVLRTIVAALNNPDWWSDVRVGGMPVKIDLQHELREVARFEMWGHLTDDPAEKEAYEYHENEFELRSYQYEYVTNGGWRDFSGSTDETPTFMKVPFVYIPATRLPFPRKDLMVAEYVLSEGIVSDDVFDSRQAFRTMQRFDNPDTDKDRSTLSYHEFRTLEARTSHLYLRDGEWENQELRPNLRRAALERKDALIKTTMECAASICRDILKPEALSEHSHSTESGLKGEMGVSQVAYRGWRAHTHHESYEPTTIGELSAGTQGPLMWLTHLVTELHDFFVEAYRHRLTHHKFCRVVKYDVHFDPEDDRTDRPEYTAQEFVQIGSPPGYAWGTRLGPNGECISWEQYIDQGNPYPYCAVPTPLTDEAPDEWRRMPFILLIDEIENHLHPAWQRRVIPALLETFPNMQLIATTHSPFVVAGRQPGQVHRMFRDDDGTVRTETSGRDFVGWTTDDILREFMGIDDPTDEETAVASAVLRWLRTQEPGDGEAAEEWRQQQITQPSGGDASPSIGDLVALGCLERLPVLTGQALEWWEDQIAELDRQVGPNLEFQGSVIAEREQYIAELEEILWRLEERFGENFLDD